LHIESVEDRVEELERFYDNHENLKKQIDQELDDLKN
jgi:hypothetical protein